VRWLQQDNLIYVGLIGIGVVIMQPFIAAASLDLPSKICVVALSLANPLLAVLVMLTQVQPLHHYASYPGYLFVAKTVGQVSAFVGVVAAFWHVLWLAGVLVLVSGSVWFALYATYYKLLERDEGIRPHKQKHIPDDRGKRRACPRDRLSSLCAGSARRPRPAVARPQY
jgi:hypothetical protein